MVSARVPIVLVIFAVAAAPAHAGFEEACAAKLNLHCAEKESMECVMCAISNW